MNKPDQNIIDKYGATHFGGAHGENGYFKEDTNSNDKNTVFQLTNVGWLPAVQYEPFHLNLTMYFDKVTTGKE